MDRLGARTFQTFLIDRPFSHIILIIGRYLFKHCIQVPLVISWFNMVKNDTGKTKGAVSMKNLGVLSPREKYKFT